MRTVFTKSIDNNGCCELLLANATCSRQEADHIFQTTYVCVLSLFYALNHQTTVHVPFPWHLHKQNRMWKRARSWTNKDGVDYNKTAITLQTNVVMNIELIPWIVFSRSWWSLTWWKPPASYGNRRSIFMFSHWMLLNTVSPSYSVSLIPIVNIILLCKPKSSVFLVPWDSPKEVLYAVLVPLQWRTLWSALPDHKNLRNRKEMFSLLLSLKVLMFTWTLLCELCSSPTISFDYIHMGLGSG